MGTKTLLSAIWEKGLLILGTSSPSPHPLATIHKTTAGMGRGVLLREHRTKPGALDYNSGYIGIRRLSSTAV